MTQTRKALEQKEDKQYVSSLWVCQLTAKRRGLAPCLAYTNSLNICCLTKWANISCTSGERDFFCPGFLFTWFHYNKTILKTSTVCYNEICILFKTTPVTVPTVMVTKPYSFSFPTAFYTSRFFSCHFLADPSPLIFSIAFQRWSNLNGIVSPGTSGLASCLVTLSADF